MSSRIVRAVFSLVLFAAGGASAQQSDSQQARAEIALSNDTLQMRYLLNRRLGLALSGQAFYGPDILTFGSADSLTDLSARVEMNVAPRLTAFGGTRTLQEELFVGVGYRF
jgi:hypothetical protein